MQNEGFLHTAARKAWGLVLTAATLAAFLFVLGFLANLISMALPA